MPTFAYRAVTPEGQTREGRESARSTADLRRQLRDRGLLVVTSEKAKGGRRRRLTLGGRRREVARVFHYLATLLEAGFTLDRALRTAARFATRADVAGALEQVQGAIREGQPLADALASHPEVFPRIAVGMARAGERGGHLSEAVDNLASHLERQRALRARLAGAMVYPAVMLLAGGVSVLVLVLYVLPRFTELLAGAGLSLPLSTRLLLTGSEAAAVWWPVLPVAIMVIAWALRRYMATDAGGVRVHRLLLRLPVVGRLRRRRAAGHLGRTLATLLSQGVPALTSLDVAASTSTDRAVARDLGEARSELRAGASMAATLRGCGHFPESFLQMVHVGEEGGRLPELLDRGAELAEEELEDALDGLIRLVEPAVIILFGVIVGFIALSLLQAVYGIHAAGLS